MEKRFVLVIDWSIDGSNEQSVELFATKKAAQKFMKQDYYRVCEEFDQQADDCDIAEMSAECYENGTHAQNYCLWHIYEKEVKNEEMFD